MDWLAFFDADEFLFLMNSSETHVGDVLRDYNEFSGLGVNWVQFSSSGHERRPLGMQRLDCQAPSRCSVGGLRANYHRCLPPDHFEHRHIKTIVHTGKQNTYKEVEFEGPHSLLCAGDTLTTICTSQCVHTATTRNTSWWMSSSARWLGHSRSPLPTCA